MIILLSASCCFCFCYNYCCGWSFCCYCNLRRHNIHGRGSCDHLSGCSCGLGCSNFDQGVMVLFSLSSSWRGPRWSLLWLCLCQYMYITHCIVGEGERGAAIGVWLCTGIMWLTYSVLSRSALWWFYLSVRWSGWFGEPVPCANQIVGLVPWCKYCMIPN